jgi:tRNA (guanine26-N2/guanine27-N2)-dimethyltransferase
MTASGVRAARYVLECLNVSSAVAADSQPEAVAFARNTIRLNGLADRISVVESDANQLLLNHMKERFDLIDLDPFGSPAPFFECALRATADRGVLAATATDMAPLTGARSRACLRKYGINPVRTEFEKETAVRILTANLALCASKLGLGIDIAFSHATDHYARLFANVSKGRAQASQTARSLGFLEYCPKCLMRVTRSSIEEIQNECTNCGTRTKVGGPIWLGRLWEEQTVQNMVDRTPLLSSSRLSEVQDILAAISDEQRAQPFYYRTDALSKSLRLKPPPLKKVLTELRHSGFQASRTHFHPNGFRTNAAVKELRSVLKTLSRSEA